MQSNFTQEVRSFVVSNYLLGREDGLSNNDSFQDRGIIDSTGILELVSHLEQNYSIEVLDDELNPDNLDSVDRIAAYLTRKLSPPPEEQVSREHKVFSL